MSKSLVPQLLATVQVPQNHDLANHAKPIFPLLIGSAAGLIEARRLIMPRRGRKLARPPRDGAVDLGRLGQNLKRAVESEEVKWNAPALSTWSIGFFLNKTQMNIALALDKSVSVWLKAKLDRGAPGALTANEIFDTDLPSRLALLRILVRGEAGAMIQELASAFHQCPNGDTATRALQKFSRRLGKGKDQGCVDAIYASLREEDAFAATAIVAGRVAVFQSFERRADRGGVDLAVEIALTAKALTAVAKVWRALLTDTVKASA